MNFCAKLEKETYKKNQFKVQLVQNELKGTEIDRVDHIGLNGTKVDRSRLNWTKWDRSRPI